VVLSKTLILGEADISWDAVADPGGTLPVVYDTLRSSDPADFLTSALCLESDDSSDTLSSDSESPLLSALFYYLVRAENECPLMPGYLGSDSSGSERLGGVCP
jgi:hypothetical protein